jgi:hypothetical protein
LLKENGVCNTLKISGGNRLDLDLYEGRELAGCYAGRPRVNKQMLNLIIRGNAYEENKDETKIETGATT